MTDEELIEALRSIDHMNVDDCFLQSHFYSKAAARIEELVRDRGDLVQAQESLVETLSKSGRKRKDAEAKLAKAIDALRLVVTAKGLTDPTEYGYDTIVFARAALAELEKRND